MRNTSFYVWIILLMACGGTRVVSFYNPTYERNKYKSFTIRENYDHDKLSREHQKLDSLILDEVRKGFLSLGYKESSLPDLYVTFQINLNTTSETHTERNYYSGYNYYGYSPYPYNIYTTNYKEGVVILEVRNDNNKLVWQGSKDFKVKKGKETSELLIETIGEIARSFKPLKQL